MMKYEAVIIGGGPVGFMLASEPCDGRSGNMCD